MTSARGLLVVLGTALLTGAAWPAPAQAAAGYFCLTATAVATSDGYRLSNIGCTGSGLENVPVLVWSGPAAGEYVCRRVTYTPLQAEFDATGCVRT